MFAIHDVAVVPLNFSVQNIMKNIFKIEFDIHVQVGQQPRLFHIYCVREKEVMIWQYFIIAGLKI